MRRVPWLLLLGVVGWVACGNEGPPPRPVPPAQIPDTLHPLPGTPPSDGGLSGHGAADGGIPPDAGTPEPDAGVEPPDAGPPPPPTSGLPDLNQLRPGEYPPVQPRIPTFELRVDPDDLAKLEEHPLSDDTVPVEVVLDGHRAPGQIRYRGASTRTLPQKSYKVELDPGWELEDRDHFELLASYNDGGKLSEKFASDLYLALGLPVPRARYVTVRLNGTHQGLYLEMEHVGKDYLKHHRMERGASVYRCGHRNCELTLSPGPYQTDFEKKSNEDLGDEDLQALLAWVNRADDSELETKLAARVNVEAYLGNLAADALISNAVVEDSRSYWIHELGRDVWTYVPWDLNNARLVFWRTWEPEDPPITRHSAQPFTVYDAFVQTMWETRVAQRSDQRPTWSVLASRVWDRPALRARLLAKLEAALTTGPFTEAKAGAHIDALWDCVGPELARDPYVSADHMRRARDFLKTYVLERREYLLAQLRALKAHGSGPLLIREVTAGAGGSVELYNRGATRLELGRYSVTPNLRRPLLYRLPSGLALEPGQSVRLLADGLSQPGHLPFTLSPLGGEVGVFDASRSSPAGRPLVYGPADAVWFGPLPAGTAYGRVSPASENFTRRPAPP
ncbi:CotH kinase family protein [Myxococcaceae bacterium GXIMD 01537]